jgi:predicted tellurium resistance membrane protein TerC
VIAVAAAAKGSMSLLIIGLGVSIPLIIFGSAVLLKVMDRFPIIITIGGALLGYVAGDMAVHDGAVSGWIHANAPWLATVAPLAGAAFVVALGKYLAAKKPAEAAH